MTRGQLVAELLQLWEGSAKQLEKDKAERSARDVRTAISILEQTYSAEEMGIGRSPSSPVIAEIGML